MRTARSHCHRPERSAIVAIALALGCGVNVGGAGTAASSGGASTGGAAGGSPSTAGAGGGSASGSGGNSVGGSPLNAGGASQSGAGGTPAAGGTAGGNAGTATAGGGGTAGSSAADRCHGGTALCDDFEDGASTPDASKWAVLTSYSGMPSTVNSIVVDGTQSHDGHRAAHVHTTTGDPVYLEARKLPGTGNHFFVRAFAYFDVDPGAKSRGHWGAVVGVGKKAGGTQDVEVRFGGQFDILVANYSPNDALQISSSKDGFYDDGMKLPVQKWTCLEVELDGAGNSLRVFMDGAEIERLHVTDWGQFGHQPTPDWAPVYDRIRIGYQSWNADTPVDVWYDSIAIDVQRIGCGT
jgi:hypothetical protein